MDTLDAVALLHQCEQSVIRQHEVLSAMRLRYDCLPRTAHSWIDHHNKNRARGVVRSRSVKKARTIKNGKWRDLVREVDNAHIWHDRIHYPPPIPDHFIPAPALAPDTHAHP